MVSAWVADDLVSPWCGCCWWELRLAKSEIFRLSFPRVLAYRPCHAPDRLTCVVRRPAPGAKRGLGLAERKDPPGDELPDVATRDHFVVAAFRARLGSDAGRCGIVGWVGHRVGFR